MQRTPSRRTPRTLVAVGALALGLLFAACGGGGGDESAEFRSPPERKGDVTRDEMEASFTGYGDTPEYAECVTDEVFEDLDQDELNELYDVFAEQDYDGVTHGIRVAEEAAYNICSDPEDLVSDLHS